MTQKRPNSSPPPREPRKSINVNVPKSLRDRVDVVISKSGLDLTQVIIKALNSWLPRAEKRLAEEENGDIL